MRSGQARIATLDVQTQIFGMALNLFLTTWHGNLAKWHSEISVKFSDDYQTGDLEIW